MKDKFLISDCLPVAESQTTVQLRFLPYTWPTSVSFPWTSDWS